MRILTVLAVSALAVTGPAMLSNTGLAAFEHVDTAYAGKRGSRYKPAADAQTSANAATAAAPAKGRRGKRAEVVDSGAQKVATTSNRPKRNAASKQNAVLQAQLKELDALNSDAKTFFDSTDPKMAPLRAIAAAHVMAAGIEHDLAEKQVAIAAEQRVLDGLTAKLELAPGGLMAQRTQFLGLRDSLLAEEPGKDDASHADWTVKLAGANAGLETVSQLAENLRAVTAGKEALAKISADLDDSTLRAAIAQVINATGTHSVTADALLPAVYTFVSEKLGVGDAHGLIDVAVEQQKKTGESLAEGAIGTKVEPA